MELTFAEIVDEVRDLPTEGKHELIRLLEKDLILERRQEILKNGEEAKRAFRNGELKRYTSVDDLMEDLNA